MVTLCVSITAGLVLLLVFISLARMPKRSGSATCDKPKQVEFEVEFYPFSGKYYPKFRGNFLYHNGLSGVYTTQSDMLYAEGFHCEERAINCLKQFREQRSKVGVLTKSVSLD